MASLASVSDGRLLRALRELVVRDQQAEAELLRVLGEVGARRLYLERGYSSLFAYCTEVLNMSEATAYHRIQVAKAARRFPALLDRIREGSLHLSGAKLLAPHLTAENQAELLDLAKRRSKRTIEELLADRAPKPDVPALVRKLPEIPPARPVATPGPPPTAMPTSPTRSPEPLGHERYKIEFTASRALRDKLREAQALLRHRVPSGASRRSSVWR
jgi:hypothetical protein